MPEIRLNIPADWTPDSWGDLQAELKSLAEVHEPPANSYDITSLLLVVSFSANALQIADILANWLKRKPRGNQAEIRLSDGRTFKLEGNSDPDEFVKQLRAALKEL